MYFHAALDIQMVTQYGEGSGTTFGFASYNYDYLSVTMQYQIDAWQYFEPFPDVISLSFAGPIDGRSYSGYGMFTTSRTSYMATHWPRCHPCVHLHTHLCYNLTGPYTAMPIHDRVNINTYMQLTHIACSSPLVTHHLTLLGCALLAEFLGPTGSLSFRPPWQSMRRWA